VKGLSPWILYDFRSPRRINGHQEGFNRKGLIDADRVTTKMAFGVLRDYYRRIQGRHEPSTTDPGAAETPR
jgi:beta-glucuronidase